MWAKRRGEIKAGRKKIAWLLLGVLGLTLLLPWQTHVQGAGWIHPELQYPVYSPLSGRLVALPTPGKVAQGQELFVVESPDLRLAADRASGLAQARARELVGLAGLPEGEQRRTSVQSQRDQYLAEAQLYEEEQSRMKLTAPFGGVLYDLDPQLATGVWVNPRQLLATVVDPTQWVVDAYIAEADIARVRPGDKARVQAGPQSISFLSGRVTEVDAARTTVLPHSILDAQAGGPILTLSATKNSERHVENAPRDAIYRVRIALDQPLASGQMQVGKVVISAQARAWLPSALERIASVLLRESGF